MDLLFSPIGERESDIPGFHGANEPFLLTTVTPADNPPFFSAGRLTTEPEKGRG